MRIYLDISQWFKRCSLKYLLVDRFKTQKDDEYIEVDFSVSDDYVKSDSPIKFLNITFIY